MIQINVVNVIVMIGIVVQVTLELTQDVMFYIVLIIAIGIGNVAQAEFANISVADGIIVTEVKLSQEKLPPIIQRFHLLAVILGLF